MFKHLFPTLLIPVMLLGAGCAGTQTPASTPEAAQEVVPISTLTDGTYVLDAPSSSIKWNAQKRVGAKHNGTVEAKEGALVMQEGAIIGGSFVADMTTIVDLDLTDEKFNTLLTNHLKSDDFFAVETYPSATFAVSEVVDLEGIDGATHRVTGTMTIKGIENELSLPAWIEADTGGVHATGTATLDRTLWDVRYGSDRFFDNLGDELIEDVFTLTFDMRFVAVE